MVISGGWLGIRRRIRGTQRRIRGRVALPLGVEDVLLTGVHSDPERDNSYSPVSACDMFLAALPKPSSGFRVSSTVAAWAWSA
jgi:hypothetical protein